ncbi:MAG: MXAN_5808 family serine peptidase [Pseudomonadota bacterium]
MSTLFKHFLMLSGATCVSLVGYHAAVCMGGFEGAAVRAGALLQGATTDPGYRLADLRLFDRTRYFVSERYVDPSREDPEAMFDAALDAVARQVDSVLFSREPGGRLLHMSVGSYTTTLVMAPIEDLDALRVAVSQVVGVLQERLDPSAMDLREVEYALCNGMLSTLDPHSVLMPPDDAQDMNSENQGEFGGLGITITLRKGRLTVEYPLEDTPAYRVGLKAGDHIVRIEEESTVNMGLEEAVSRLRGPVGKPVTIMVMRDMWSEPRPFTIVRDLIRINPVEGQVLEGGVGYLRIKAFHANVSRDMDAVLAGFRRDLGGPPVGLVLDLRDNPGGFLNQAVEVADRFLDSGVVVSTMGADGHRDIERASSAKTEPDYPVVVLTSAHSASASEIVAGALRNLDRAAVFGERSFGKGSVQHLYENTDDSELKLTVAEYYTPGDHSIQSIGIPPDVALIPYVVHPAGEDDPETGEPDERMVYLAWRERVTREAGLDRHLAAHSLQLESPAYSIAYLRDITADREARSKEHKDLARDWEIQFAREVLLSADGARRADVVAAAGAVVARRREAEEATIREAFTTLGVDWSAGPLPASPQLSVTLDLGPDGMLIAGQEEDITISATNQGSAPLYQVMAVSSSGNERLDGYESFFGRIDPGQTRSWVQPVKLDPGFPTETDEVAFALRDGQGHALGRSTHRAPVQGSDIPRFSYQLRLLDDGTGGGQGDGDGVLEVGETVDIAIEVTNLSEVGAANAFARLRNTAGPAFDLKAGTVELGALAAGATGSGHFTLALRSVPPAGEPSLELAVGDGEFYDYGAVLRAGFYDYPAMREELRLPVLSASAEPDPDAAAALAAMQTPRQPPELKITRRPDGLVNDRLAVISGQVTDDAGVKDVIVYHTWQEDPLSSCDDGERPQATDDACSARLPGEKKIFFRGGAPGVTAVPFTVEQELHEGPNTFVFLAHDDQGLSLARSVTVIYRPGQAVTVAQ